MKMLDALFHLIRSFWPRWLATNRTCQKGGISNVQQERIAWELIPWVFDINFFEELQRGEYAEPSAPFQLELPLDSHVE